YKFGIIISLIFAVVVGGFAVYAAKTKTHSNTATKTLTEKQRQTYEGQLAQADADLAAASTDQDKSNFYQDKGLALASLGRSDEAKQAYAESIRLNPNNAGAYSGLFALQVNTEDFDGAQQSIRKAIELEPTSTRWKKYIAFSQEQLNASDEAINTLYQDSLRSVKNNKELITSYARFLEEIGNKPAAIEQWKKAIEIDAEHKAKYEAEMTRLQE